MLQDYLKQIGLENVADRIDEYELNDFVAEAFAADVPSLSEAEIKKLYIYDVPKMSPDGSCSIIEEKAEKPYNLAETFGLTNFRHAELDSAFLDSRFHGNDKVIQDDNIDWSSLRKHPQTIRLWRLRQIVAKIFAETSVDWFGIYRKVNKRELDSRLRGNDKKEDGNDKDANYVLVKEAYAGLFSRAEFPLTKEFAKKSNNSTVGLLGKAIVIQDVAAHTGAYYKCDGKVNSEFCAPILSKDSIASLQNDKPEVIGIIDAEAFPKNHYTDERLLQIAKVAYDLGNVDLGLNDK